MAKLKWCTAKTRKGKRCHARPLKGTRRCGAHPLSTGLDPVFGSPEQAAAAGKLGGRPRLPLPHERMRELVEENIEALVAPYLEAVRDSVVVAKYEGEVLPSEHPDLGARVAAVERLLDRVYGKPRQVSEISGPGGAPIPLSATPDLSMLSTDEKRLLVSLLEKAEADVDPDG